MNKVKSFLAKNKKRALAIFASAFTALSMAVCACAADSTESALAGASGQIIDQFTGAANDITPIILGVLGAGLIIFVIFVGIKLAKKMFSTVAK